ncbi:hypothetical protein B0E53_04071 [Micromonospora sp. MH33]|nr:hypothetical protein B0E53_04071 [Micromonospora sp. MH33]
MLPGQLGHPGRRRAGVARADRRRDVLRVGHHQQVVVGVVPGGVDAAGDVRGGVAVEEHEPGPQARVGVPGARVAGLRPVHGREGAGRAQRAGRREAGQVAGVLDVGPEGVGRVALLDGAGDQLDDQPAGELGPAGPGVGARGGVQAGVTAEQLGRAEHPVAEPGGEHRVELGRSLPGTAAEARLQLQLEHQRARVGVRAQPDPDVVQAVLQVPVPGAGVELGGAGGGHAVVVVAERVGVADPPLPGQHVRPDVQLDQPGPGVERLGQVGVGAALVRVVDPDAGGGGEPGLRRDLGGRGAGSQHGSGEGGEGEQGGESAHEPSPSDGPAAPGMRRFKSTKINIGRTDRVRPSRRAAPPRAPSR